MRLKPRLDSNHSEIVAAFEGMGCTVLSLAAMGKGCGDALIGLECKNYLCEFKDGSKPPSARELTPAEKKFSRTWRGHYQIICSPKEAIAAVKEWRRL